MDNHYVNGGLVLQAAVVAFIDLIAPRADNNACFSVLGIFPRTQRVMGKHLTFLFVATCLSMSGCAVESGTTNKGYDQDLLKQGVRFLPPSGWNKTVDRKQPRRLVGVTFAFLDRIVSAGGRKYPEAIMSVSVIEYSKNEFEADVSMVQEKKEQVNLAGVPGYFWFTESGPQGVKVKRKTYMLFKDNKMYLFTYSSYSALAEKETLETYLPVFEQAVSTFELVK